MKRGIYIAQKVDNNQTCRAKLKANLYGDVVGFKPGLSDIPSDTNMSVELVIKTYIWKSPLSSICEGKVSHVWQCILGYVCSFLALIASVARLHKGLAADETISDMFFFPRVSLLYPKGHWLFPKSDPKLTFLLHTVFNSGFIILCVFCCLAVIASFFLKNLARYRYAFVMLVMTIIIVSFTVAVMKAHSGRYCPSKMERYGGVVAENYRNFPLPKTERRHADCFAAGHPAPGFSLMVLGAIATTGRRRLYGYLAGIGMGTVLSFIQIARGEHFLSHCLATFLIALWFSYAIPGLFKWISKRTGFIIYIKQQFV